jgi:transposase
MPRFATVAPHLSVPDLAARYRQAHDPVARTRWQIVGYSPNWVRTILRRYNADGPEGLVDQRSFHRGGNPPLLSPALKAELVDALDGPAPDGGCWSCRQAAAWMAERLGRPVADVRGWEVLRALGFTLQRPRPRATQADPAAQDAFKKGGSRRRWTRSGPPIPPPR